MPTLKRIQTDSEGLAAERIAKRVANAICVDYPLSEAHWESALLGPLAEFLSRPGKQFRGSLVRAAWQIAGGRANEMPEDLPLVLELLHAGSLIVDDIQDGSPQRRGGPSLHEIYGLPIALNTGNWLYFASSSLVEELEGSDSLKLDLLRRLRNAVLRCHQGQALDLSAKISRVAPAEIRDLVATTTDLKTSTLVELAATMGAIAAGGSPVVVTALGVFGRELGTALQMFDDLSGLVSVRRREKGLEDLRNGRPTWPWSWASELLAQPEVAFLQVLSRKVEDGGNADLLLQELGDTVAQHGREQATIRLRSAYRQLAMRVPPSRALQNLAEEIERLEKSYA